MPSRLAAPEEKARVEERRAQILEAAARVFAQSGYHRARTRDIAAAAGVAEGTLYNYFRSKREILLALADRIIRDANSGLLRHLVDESDQNWLGRVLADRAALLERNLPLLLAVAPEMLTDAELREQFLGKVVFPYLAYVAPLVQRRLPPGRRAGARAILPAMMGGLLMAYGANALARSLPGPALSTEQLVDQLADFYAVGLLGEAAAERAEVQE